MGRNQLILLVLQYSARILPRIWRSPAVQQYRQRYPKLFYSLLLIPTAAGGALLLTGVERVAYTNRLHLALLPVEDEMSLGASAYAEVMGKEQQRILPATDQAVRITSQVAHDIIDVLKQDGFDKHMQWSVHVIESNTANAFVLPSGKIFVYTDLFKYANTTAALALVLGHECSHAIARHSVEKMGVTAMSAILTELALGYVESSQGNSLLSSAFLMGARAVGQLGVPLAHSRKLETEADQIGIMIASRAGYDPTIGKDVWVNFKAAEDAKSAGKAAKMPEFMSTHPSHERRIETLTQLAKECQPLYQQAIAERRARGLPVPNSRQQIHHQAQLPSYIIDKLDQENATAATAFQAASLIPSSSPFAQNVRLTI